VPTPNNDNAVVISLNDCCDITSLSRTALNKHRAAGTFPREVVLGERRIGFVKEEVLAWLQARIDARRAA
jgi:prophage regulatory protein